MIRNVTLIGNFSEDWTTESYIARAMRRLGLNVTAVNWDVPPISCMPFCRGADLVLFTKPWFDSGNYSCIGKVEGFVSECKKLGAVVCCWHFDYLIPGRFKERWTRDVASVVDMLFTTDGWWHKNASTYETIAAKRLTNIAVLRQAMPDDTLLNACKVDRYCCDAAFIGTVYNERTPWLGRMADIFPRSRLKVFQNVRGPGLSNLCASAKIVLGPDAPIFPGYWSNRLYVVAGHRGCFVAPKVEGMAEEGWHPNVNYFAYDPLWPDKRLKDYFEFLIEDNNWRREVADRARDEAEKRHTYYDRVRQLLDILHERNLG